MASGHGGWGPKPCAPRVSEKDAGVQCQKTRARKTPRSKENPSRQETPCGQKVPESEETEKSEEKSFTEQAGFLESALCAACDKGMRALLGGTRCSGEMLHKASCARGMRPLLGGTRRFLRKTACSRKQTRTQRNPNVYMCTAVKEGS